VSGGTAQQLRNVDPNVECRADVPRSRWPFRLTVWQFDIEHAFEYTTDTTALEAVRGVRGLWVQGPVIRQVLAVHGVARV